MTAGSLCGARRAVYGTLVLFDRRPAGEMARLGDPAIGQMGASRIEQPGKWRS